MSSQSEPEIVETVTLKIIPPEPLPRERSGRISSLTVESGTRKDGKTENIQSVTLRAGQTLAIVGPTGSGKSEFLSDIEQLADRDTLSGRKILINGAPPDHEGFQTGLVAQLTQKTSFIMDCSVSRFLALHAESRQKDDPDLIKKVIEKANTLSGEAISENANLQVLSGGQSRALMIADIAYISNSPVILIDEIENAGIDKLAALDVLTDSNKSILISTHDPVLMLMVPRRLVMKNGGMDKLLTTSDEEFEILEKLKTMDRLMTRTRNLLRNGKQI